MKKTIFTPDVPTSKEHIIIEGKEITDYAGIISADVSALAKEKGRMFADEIDNGYVTDFEKSEKYTQTPDRMVHVSTFVYANENIYMTYYANTKEASEDPVNQTARLVYCPVNDTENKTFTDIQKVGDDCYDGKVVMVYDTILMQKDEDTLFILWTANISGKYYRLFRTYRISDGTLGEVMVNRFKVGEITNDFSTTGIQNALSANGIGYKTMYSDIGIMQKITSRTENGETYYYSGAYSGDFNCIIKSKDFITWEYVSQPDFLNRSKWENATYVLNDKCYYFVRQHDDTKYGFLTYYDLVSGEWAKPVLIEDCQSRSDFIMYGGELYLFHAPCNREHIGIVRINTENLAESEVVLQSHIHSSCFYPFVQYGNNNELCMSYTVNRQHIRLAQFKLGGYLR
ncbi:MAG: hypothetical protein IJO52_08505 [Clostridia bacterium]|nr:hypothetical protein [Clostridia bacterium]